MIYLGVLLSHPGQPMTTGQIATEMGHPGDTETTFRILANAQSNGLIDRVGRNPNRWQINKRGHEKWTKLQEELLDRIRNDEIVE